VLILCLENTLTDTRILFITLTFVSTDTAEATEATAVTAVTAVTETGESETAKSGTCSRIRYFAAFSDL
jgi:hypothetical protein